MTKQDCQVKIAQQIKQIQFERNHPKQSLASLTEVSQLLSQALELLIRGREEPTQSK